MPVKEKGKKLRASSAAAATAAVASGSTSDPAAAYKRKQEGAGPSSSSSAAGTKRRRHPGVLRFIDDAANVAGEEEDESDGEAEEDFVDDRPVVDERRQSLHRQTVVVKEEVLSGDELEEFIKDRYRGVKYADDNDSKDPDGLLSVFDALREPTVWRVKCMAGRERQMSFCFMQKFVDLFIFGTKVPIISAFALDHVRGYVFVEAEKASDVVEACKGFVGVYINAITLVPASEVPGMLGTRSKPYQLSPGTWVRMKNGNYKGDLAQVVSVDDGQRKALVKLIPRVDLRAIAQKFGGAVSLKEAAIPAPRLISSRELEYFGSHIVRKRDRQTGETFEVLDGLMFKDGYLYKRVTIGSLIYWGIEPSETELLKFSTPSKDDVVEDMEWVSNMYGRTKKQIPDANFEASTSRGSYSKGSSSKTAKLEEDQDDDINLYDLVLIGRKDFGVIVAVEKAGYKVLKGGPEGSADVIRKQDIKKVIVDKMFTALDQQKKTISINDTVKVLEGPFQGREGAVKHLCKGTLFICDENESENGGYFSVQSEFCEVLRKPKEPVGTSAEDVGEGGFSSISQPFTTMDEAADNSRSRRFERDQLFSVGQTLRIRKGPLKGYLCRVVRIFRNDVTVKLDSLVKMITVEAAFLSVPSERRDDVSGAGVNAGSVLGGGAETGGSSWDKGFQAFASDSWQPFSSSAFVDGENDDKKTGEGQEIDPWGSKAASASAKNDSADDIWSKAPSSNTNLNSSWDMTEKPTVDVSDQHASGQKDVDLWNSSTSQKGTSQDRLGKAAEVGWGVENPKTSKDEFGSGSFSSWDTAPNRDKGTDEANPWEKRNAAKKGDGSWGKVQGQEPNSWGNVGNDGSKSSPWEKAKAVATTDDDNWGKVQVPQEPTSWSSAGNASEKMDKGMGLTTKDSDSWSKVEMPQEKEGWDAAVANCEKQSTNAGCQADNWVSAKDSSVGQDDSWGKPKDKGKPEGVAWNKSGMDFQDSSDNWGKPKSSHNDAHSNWGTQDMDKDNLSDNWSQPQSFGGGRGRGRGQDGGDSNKRTDWMGGNDGDNEAGGGRFDRGRGSSGFGGRGRGRGWDNNQGSLDRPASKYGNDGTGDKSDWGGGSSSGFSAGATWKETAAGDTGNDWAGSSKNTSSEKNKSVGWNSSGEPGQDADPWASKMPSNAGPRDNDDGWNTKGADANHDNESAWNVAPVQKGKEAESSTGGGWGSGSASGWSQTSSQLGELYGNSNSENNTGSESGWNNSLLNDDGGGSGRGGYRGRGRGRSFGDRDGGQRSTWGGGDDRPREGGWRARRDFDGDGGGRGGWRGRGRDCDGDGGGRGSWRGRARDSDGDGGGRGSWRGRGRDFDGDGGGRGSWRGRGRFGSGGRGGDSQENNNWNGSSGQAGWSSGQGNKGGDGGDGERSFNRGRGGHGSWSSRSSDSNNDNGGNDSWSQGGRGSWSSRSSDTNNDNGGNNSWSHSNAGTNVGGSSCWKNEGGSSAWGKQPSGGNTSKWGGDKGDSVAGTGRDAWGDGGSGVGDNSWEKQPMSSHTGGAAVQGGDSAGWEKPVSSDAGGSGWDRAAEQSDKDKSSGGW